MPAMVSVAGTPGGTVTNIATTFNIVTGVSLASGVTYTGFGNLAGTSATNTITGGNGLTYTFTGSSAASANGWSWTSFEVINDAGNATFTAGSAISVTTTALIGGTLDLTGSAASWNFVSPSLINGSTSSAGITVNGGPVGGNLAPDLTYRGAYLQGPSGSATNNVVASVGALIAEIAARALDEAFDTDSVAKQIKDGFVGDVGTTPPMDHRIDDTGISVPECFNESREGQGSCP